MSKGKSGGSPRDHTAMRRGTKPRPLRVKAVSAPPRDCAPAAFTAARATLVDNVIQGLIDRGVCYVDAVGVVHVKKDPAPRQDDHHVDTGRWGSQTDHDEVPS